MFMCLVDDVLGDTTAATVPNVDRFEELQSILFLIARNGDQ
jgi:hypothetical protein